MPRVTMKGCMWSLAMRKAVERGDDEPRDGHAGEERQDQGQRLGDAGIVSRRERDRLQAWRLRPAAQRPSTRPTDRSGPARMMMPATPKRRSMRFVEACFRMEIRLPTGRKLGSIATDDSKEQKQAHEVQRVLEQRILQLLRVHFLRIRHFLNLFIHIAQPDA